MKKMYTLVVLLIVYYFIVAIGKNENVLLNLVSGLAITFLFLIVNYTSVFKRLRFAIVTLLLSFISFNSFADYTIADGTIINASTITGQSGVLTINGTLNVNSNVSLSNFTTVIINGPNGQIYWPGNQDLTFSSGVSISILNNALGLQPTGGNASKRLIIGTVVIAVSNDNSNNAAFSFEEFNGAGGLPQFILSTSVGTVCSNSSFTATITPLNNTIQYDCAWTISAAGTRSPTSHSGFSDPVTTTITPTSSGTYTVTCKVYQAGDADPIVTKTKTVTVNPAPGTPTLTSATPASICQGGSSDIKATSAGNTIQWYTVSSGGTSIGTSASAANYSVSPSTTTTYYAEAKIAATSCTSINRSSAVVTVSPPTVAGTISGGGITVCSGSNSTTLTLSGHTGSVTKWESSLDNFATAGTAISNTTSSLTINNLAASTYYRAVVASGACSAANSSSTLISIASPGVWLGANTNWNSPLNWCGGSIPTSATNVTINNGLSYYPDITGTANVNNITIATGGTANVLISSSGTLKIAGAISSTNDINAAAGKVEFIGSSAQTVRADNFVSNTIANLVISNTRSAASAASPSVAVNAAGGSLSISGGVSFGSLNNAVFQTNDNLILLSSSASTAYVADLTNNSANSGNKVAGKVVVQRYIPPKRAWRLLTAPVTGASDLTINQAWQDTAVDVTLGQRNDPHPGYGTHITGGPNRNPSQGFDVGPKNASIYFYDYSINGWGVIPATTNNLAQDGRITAQQGYLIFVRGDRNTNLALATAAATSPAVLRPKGYLNIDDYPVTLPSGSGFKIIGNPYASSIQFDKIYQRDLAGNNVISNNSYYLLDPNLTGSNGVGAFVGFTEGATPGTYVRTVYSPNAEFSSIPTDGSIQSGSAFVVLSTNGGTLTIKETDKVSSSNNAAFRPAKNQVRTSLYAYNADGTRSLNDGVINIYDDRFTNDAVESEDVLKMYNLAENLTINRGNKLWAAEKRKIIEVTDTIFYGIYGMKQKNYELEVAVDSLIHPNLTAYMEDAYLKRNTLINIKDTTRIQFSINADKNTYAADRFKLIFKPLIKFAGIQAEMQVDDVVLDWTVAGENDIAFYEIERSTDGVNFTTLQTKLSNGVNTNENVSYGWLDIKPEAGRYYFYRVRCMGANGAVAYSEVRKVRVVRHSPVVTVYPNPVVNGIIGLQMVNMPSGDYSVSLLTLNGQVLFTTLLNHAESYSESISLNQDVTTGVYKLQITKPDGTIIVQTVLIGQ